MGNAYLGSKATARLCQAIIALMPPQRVYIESHLGGGATMKRKPAAQRSIGIDVDVCVIRQFRCEYPVELVHGCCHRYLSRFAFDGSELAYADPPYLKFTSKAPGRYRYRYDYDYEEQDHVQLLEILRQLRCQVMNQAGAVTEKVWFNFEPQRVHWCRYVGRNFTDRQRIKRKAETWSRCYREMPHGERLAVLSAIMATVSRQSLNDMMAEQRSQFAALLETLLSVLLVLLLLEKKTKKTSAASGLPSSLTPFDRTPAASRKGAKSKGPKPERGAYAKVCLEVEQQTSPVVECRGYGEDLSEAAVENQARRVLDFVSFVKSNIVSPLS